MAFKPIVVEKEIDGVIYTAQFNGMSQRTKVATIASEGIEGVAPYLFENVLVDPKILDVDEYFGTDAEHYDNVLTFLTKVASADKEYFPASDKVANKGKGK